MQVGMAQSSGRKRGGEMKVLIACEESQTVARGNPGGKEKWHETL